MELSKESAYVRQKRNGDDERHDKTMSYRKKRKFTKLSAISMFECVQVDDIKGAVSKFLEIYQQDNLLGMLEVKICILQSAGCIRKYNRKLGEDDQEIMSYFEDWNEREANPQLLLDGRQKKFYTSFCKFVESLIDTCEISNILYDKFMLDKLLLFFGFVVLSEDKTFRHATTLSALMTMRTLVKIIVRKNEQIRKHNSQLNAEMQKSNVLQEMFRIQELQTSIKTLKKELLEVQHSVGYLRKHVFETKILDCNNRIRSICFLEIGEWLIIHPEMVFQGNYLDYLLIPFANAAEVTFVHTLCFSILKSMFDEAFDSVKNGDLVQSFAKDIKPVLLRLALSCETKLSSEAFCLLTKISQFDVLEDGETEQFYKLVYLNHPYRATAKMVGEFVICQLTKRVEEDIAFSKNEAAAKTSLMYHLVHFHIKHGNPGNGAFLVDSVDDWAPILQDWKSLKMFLLEAALSDEEEIAFIEILAMCTWKAAMGEIPEGNLIRVIGTQAAKKTEHKRKIFSEEFISDLPLLIKTFGDDPAKIGNVLLVAQCVSLDCYVTLRKENSLIDLLKEIRIVIEMSSDSKVLVDCVRTLKALCVEEHSTYAACAPICNLMMEDLGNRCIKTFQVVSDVESIIEPKLRADWLSALKRVAAFSRYFMMYDQTLFHLMIKCAIFPLSYDDKIFLECAEYSFFSCRRFLIAAIQNILYLKKWEEIQINTLRSMLDDYMNAGRALHAVNDDGLRCEAFKGICIVLFVFSKDMAYTCSFQDLNSLVYCPSMRLVRELLEFVRERIFTELPKDDWVAAKEEFARRRMCLHAFCSLLVNSIISEHEVLAEIFGQYIEFTDLFKDIFDSLIDRIKQQDKCKFSLIIHKCLELKFLKIKIIDSQEEKAEKIEVLMKLAVHFSKVLHETKVHPEQHKAVVLLHEEGIKFSMVPFGKVTVQNAAPPNIAYLEILILFVKLLTPQGRKHLYNFLRKCERFQDISRWKPFVAYRKALESGKVVVRST